MQHNKKNNLWLGLQFIISLMVSFITLKLNLINFGAKHFGIWIILASVWGIGSVLDFGFGTAIVKYIAEANKNNNTKKIITIYSTGLLLFILIGICIILVGNILAEMIFYTNTNIVPPELKDQMRTVFFILGLSFYFQYLSILFRSVFEGLSNFVISSKLLIVNYLLILIFVGIVTVLKLSIIFLSLAYMAASILTLLLYRITLRLKHQEFRFRRSAVDFKEIRKIFGFSFNVQITSLLGAFIDPVSKYIISNFVSVEIIPAYEIGRKFSVAISGLFATSFRTILPQASVLKTKQEYQAYLLNDGSKMLKLGMTYSGLVFGVGALFFATLIKFWFGFNESVIIFFILAMAESVNNMGVLAYLFLMGIGKAIYLIVVQLTNVVLTSIFIIVGFLILGNFLSLLGCFVSALIGSLIMLFFLRRETEISVLGWLKEINIYKLLLFFVLVLLSIILLFNKANIFVVTSGLSILSLLIFVKDIKEYYLMIVNIAKAKKIAFR